MPGPAVGKKYTTRACRDSFVLLRLQQDDPQTAKRRKSFFRFFKKKWHLVEKIPALDKKAFF